MLAGKVGFVMGKGPQLSWAELENTFTYCFWYVFPSLSKLINWFLDVAGSVLGCGVAGAEFTYQSSGALKFYTNESPTTTFTGFVVFFLISFGLALALAVLPAALTGSSNLVEQGSSYECGFEPFAGRGEVFESHFIVVGVLFLIFDLELIFLLPLAAAGFSLGFAATGGALLFLTLLLVGFVLEWVRGALLWPTFYAIE